jgi:hypothetical protein
MTTATPAVPTLPPINPDATLGRGTDGVRNTLAMALSVEIPQPKNEERSANRIPQVTTDRL